MDAIILQGVKTHNLKNFDLVLPHRKLYVMTGVSGSGKSSLAFDTLYAEGQRRYVESLSSYARQFLERMEKPDADMVAGIPPAIAIEAKNVITNARSTVGTQTEINDYLRVFYARVGKTICPDCGIEASTSDPEKAANFLLGQGLKTAWVLYSVPLGDKPKAALEAFLPELQKQGFSEFFLDGRLVSLDQILKKKLGSTLQVVVDQVPLESRNRKRLVESLEQAYKFGKGKVQAYAGTKLFEFAEGLRCFSCGRNFKEPVPNLFSFNSPLGACTACQGFGRIIAIDWNLVVPDENKTIAEGAIEPWTKPSSAKEFRELKQFCKDKKIPLDKCWKDLSKEHRQWVLSGYRGQSWFDNESGYFSVKDFFKYLESKTYKMHVRIFLAKYRSFEPCPECMETRLKPEALWVKVLGLSIHDLQGFSLEKLMKLFDGMKLSEHEKEKAEPVYLEITRRVRFLNDVGLGYLNLSRLSRTLSGGEVQRIHLATSLGSALVDTLYVLDEPSVGLHERDNRLLINLLHRLKSLGNTVAVVEHDRAFIEAADEVIDMGPTGGENGGRVMFQGPVDKLKKFSGSLTGQYLSGELQVKRRFKQSLLKPSHWIRIRGAAEHNLKSVDVDIPLQSFVVITGVSGSGKSTLLYDVLHKHYLRFRGRPVQDMGAAKSVKGFEHIDELVLVDQSPIGRTPRSNPVTYLSAFDDIRKLFAATEKARREGFFQRRRRPLRRLQG